MADEQTQEQESPSEGAANLAVVLDVPVTLTIELGSTRMRVRDVLALADGSVVELDREAGEPCDVLVNGRLVARAEVSSVEDRLAVRIVEVVSDAAGGPAADS